MTVINKTRYFTPLLKVPKYGKIDKTGMKFIDVKVTIKEAEAEAEVLSCTQCIN